MIELSKSVSAGAAIVSEIERRSGQQISACYQCGRCTSTCAGAFAFDYSPHRIMRLLQFGMVAPVLKSRTAQLCLACMTCSLRCPMSIDVAAVIDTAKQIADEMGLRDTERDLRLFRSSFLRNVRGHGRLHEATLLARFNLRSRRFTNDISLAPLALRKKKFHIRPPRIRNMRQLQRMFAEINVEVPSQEPSPHTLELTEECPE